MEQAFPQSIEAEQGVLGSLIIDPDAIGLVEPFLRADDFYRDAHRAIYAAILSLATRRIPADFITLCDTLEREDKLDEVGGASSLTSLINAVPTSGNVEHYARIVAHKALCRRLIQVAGQIAALAFEEAEDVAEQSETRLFAATQALPDPHDPVSIGEVLGDALLPLTTPAEPGGAITGVPGGLRPLDDVTAGFQRTDLILLAAWSGVIDEGAESGTYTLGKTVRQFEQMVEQAWTTKGSDPLHAVMVNSGTTALYGALVGCGIKPGEYIIIPAMTFTSTALACAWVGATPIFVDVTPGTWTLSLDAVRRLLAERADLRPCIKAIIPVHLYGAIMPDMAELADLAREEGWQIIEDASQAHGATLTVDSEPYYAGTMSDVGCFSMSGVKNVGVAEDGGCILTRDTAMAEYLRWWRDLGRKPGDRYGFHVPGVRGRMGSFAAAGGIVQFRHLEAWNQQRQEIAARYTEAINEIGLPLITPVVPEGSIPSFYKYVIVAGSSAERERIETCLHEAGVETEHYYPLALPDQPIYQSGALPCVVAGDLTVAQHLAACGTCLPIYPELTAAEQQRVIAAVQRATCPARHRPPPW